MARDETARERDSEGTLLDRRSYLKLAGAAGASVAAAGASSSSAAAASYDTITVPAGTTEVIDVESGQTFENKLIDITADGAHVKLVTHGSGWTVRNVGVRGENDNMDGNLGTFYLRCTEEGEALAENIYLGDGAASGCGHAAVSDWDNHGTVTVRNVHVAGWAADGMYMSHAGVSESHGMGATHVENAYLKNNNIENCRLGTPGSYIKDSVVHVESQDAVPANQSGQVNARGVWFKEQSGMKAINCDISVDGSAAVIASDGGAGTLENCRVEGSISGSVDQVNVSGSPDVSPPGSVPMSAEAAASGEIDSSSNTSPSDENTTQQPEDEQASGNQSDSSESDGEQASDEAGTLLELVADDDTASVKYEFTVEGSVRKRTSTSGSGPVSETSETLTDNGDGTVTVSGVAGNGYGDAFFVDGAITSMELDESIWTIYHGGSEVSVADLTLPNKLVIDGGNRPRTSADYTFEIDGPVRKSTHLGSVQKNDEISNGTISGSVFGGKDGYRFSGEITGFNLSGPATVRVEDGS